MPAINVGLMALIGSQRHVVSAAGGVAVAIILFFLFAPHLSLPYRVPTYMPTANSIDVADEEAAGLSAVGRALHTTRLHHLQCALVRSLVGARPRQHRARQRARLDGDIDQRADEPGVVAGMPTGSAIWIGELMPDASLARGRLGGANRRLVRVPIRGAPKRIKSWPRSPVGEHGRRAPAIAPGA